MELVYGGLMLCAVAGVVALVVGKIARPKHLTAERKREMIEHARDNDMSVNEAATHFAVSRMVIARAATGLRIELKSGRGTKSGNRKTAQEKKDMINFALSHGMSVPKAATHFNVAKETIRSWAKELMIELPSVRCGHHGNGTPGRVRLFWSCRRWDSQPRSRENRSKTSARACFKQTPPENSTYHKVHFTLGLTSSFRVKIGAGFGGTGGEL
jgi:transposase-like protein